MTDLVDDVRRVARIVSRKWSEVVAAEDVEQGIWLRVLEDGYTERLSEMDERARASVLRRIGERIASQDRDEYDHFTGQFVYDPGAVRGLLKCGQLHAGPEQRTGNGDPGSLTFTESMDLDEGAKSLRDVNPVYAATLHRVFVEGLSEADTKRVTRAVDALAREMNRVHRRRATGHDGPGSRSATTNAAARAAVEGK